jgi:hypothetical protein
MHPDGRARLSPSHRTLDPHRRISAPVPLLRLRTPASAARSGWEMTPNQEGAMPAEPVSLSEPAQEQPVAHVTVCAVCEKRIVYLIVSVR